MPRKKQLGPATPKQVLEYFDQADFGGVEVIYDLVIDIVKQRKQEERGERPEVPAVGTSAKAKKRGRKAKAKVDEASYGDESLQDA